MRHRDLSPEDYLDLIRFNSLELSRFPNKIVMYT